jgi:hypothetical protein
MATEPLLAVLLLRQLAVAGLAVLTSPLLLSRRLGSVAPIEQEAELVPDTR